MVGELGMLLTYEATRDLPLTETSIETWQGDLDVPVIEGKKLTLVPILRAGLGLLDGVLSVCARCSLFPRFFLVFFPLARTRTRARMHILRRTDTEPFPPPPPPSSPPAHGHTHAHSHGSTARCL